MVRGREDAVRVVNRTREILLGDKVRTASTLLSRFLGLLGTTAIADGGGLWIVPCRGVHTLGMRYPIDVAFLDARGVVVGILEGLPPNRFGRVFRGARGALELRSGILAATGTVPGDRLEFEEGGPA
ncbi:MAG: DUF192 domain-containing protein [Deltaproteobacteria bacterium]|nr:DUF192 domain-containing protein [Deltaproteobacteria bacterium]